jgi:hypothetical protein
MIVCLLMVMVREDCSPLPSTNKQLSLTININKQIIISHHYNQQTNNYLSPLTSTNKQSSLLLMIMVRDDCVFGNGNSER